MVKIQTNLNTKLEEKYNARKQEREEQAAQSEYTPEEKLVLEYNKFSVMRIVDLPVICNYAFIVCDDGRRKMFMYPDKNRNPNYFLYKITNKVMENKWMGKDGEGKSIFSYPVKESNKEIFEIVWNNGKSLPGQYGPNGWVQENGDPLRACFINVINRQEFQVEKIDKDGSKKYAKYEADWCVKNKQSLLLAKSVKSIGCPTTIFYKIMDTVMPNYGKNIFSYDIAIKRLDAHKNKNQIWYEVEKASNLVESQEVKNSFRDGELTEEEKQIEIYDVNEMIQPSSLSFIYSNLKGKIETIDEGLGTSFLKELEDLCSKDESNMSNEEAKETIDNVLGSDNGSKKQEATRPEPRREERAPEIRRQPASSEPTLESLASHISKIPANQRAFVKGVENGEVIFMDDKGNPVTDKVKCTDPKCKGSQPMSIDTYCIFCGYDFSQIK